MNRKKLLLAIGILFVIVIVFVPVNRPPIRYSLFSPQTSTNQSHRPGAQQHPSHSKYRLYFTKPAQANGDGKEDGIIQGLAEMIDTSQQSLDIAIYRLDLDEIVTKIIAASERGVKVRVVTDDESIYTGTGFIELHKMGIPIMHDESGAIMHNKFVIADGYTVWSGSWNFTENGTFQHNNCAIKIISPELAHRYRDEFEEMYTHHLFGSQSPAAQPSTPLSIEDILIDTCFCPDDDCAACIVDQMKDARANIRFMAFSLTEEEIVNTLLGLSESEISIQGIFEDQMADNTFSGYRKMLDAGMEVVRDGNPHLLHHKVIIIDDDRTILGSYNFSQSGNEGNDENILIIESREIAAEFLVEFEENWLSATSRE